MPIYVCKCNKCNEQLDVYRTVKEYDNLPECCGERMSRVVTAPYIAPDIQPYRSMIDGSMITSRSKHREHLRDHGCVEIGNETKYVTPKREIDITPESKARRKEKIIEKVNAIM